MLNTVTIPLLFTGNFNLLYFVVFCDTVSHLRQKMAYVVVFIQENKKRHSFPSLLLCSSGVHPAHMQNHPMKDYLFCFKQKDILSPCLCLQQFEIIDVIMTRFRHPRHDS